MSISNNKFWRQFFEHYKELSILWDKNHKDYKNKAKKKQAWKTLLQKYKECDPKSNYDFIRRKMVNIRSCYQRELKKVQQSKRAGTTENNIYVPTLWYYNCLDFLNNQDDDDLEGSGSSMDLEQSVTSHTQRLPSMVKQEPCESNDNEASNKDLHIKDVPKKDLNFKGRTKKDLLKLAWEHLESNTGENIESKIFANSWACSFRKMSAEQKLFAKKAIEEILVLGQLNQLFFDSVSCNKSDL